MCEIRAAREPLHRPIDIENTPVASDEDISTRHHQIARTCLYRNCNLRKGEHKIMHWIVHACMQRQMHACMHVPYLRLCRIPDVFLLR